MENSFIKYLFFLWKNLTFVLIYIHIYIYIYRIFNMKGTIFPCVFWDINFQEIIRGQPQ